MSTSELRFGYNVGVPPGTPAAWGARAIINPEGTVDLVHDRQSSFGPDDRVAWLLDRLNGGINRRFKAEAEQLIREAQMNTRVAKEFVLYDDGEVRVVANTCASGGYLYVAAFPCGTAEG